MTLIKHIAASGVFGTAFYLLSRSLPSSLVCFISGFLIDSDHFLDYYFDTGTIITNPKKLYSWCTELKFKKIRLLLHSYELVFPLWLAIYFFNLNIYWIAVVFGMTQHMVLDQIGNRVARPFSYFLTYRIRKKFNTELIFYKNNNYV